MIHKNYMCTLLIALICICFGCDSVGPELAKWLPENGSTSLGNGQLDVGNDAASIDASQIGGVNNGPMAQMGENSMAGFGGQMLESDGEMGPMLDDEYDAMMQDIDGQMIDGGIPTEGELVGMGEYQQTMERSSTVDFLETNGRAPENVASAAQFGSPEMSAEGNMAGLYTDGLGATSGTLPVTDGFSSNGLSGIDKPKDTRAPPKRNQGGRKSVPNIRDLPPRNQRNIPPPKTSSSNQNSNRSAGKVSDSNRPVQIGLPAQVPEPVFSVVNPVAVSILLQDGTAMSFGSELLRERELPANGTVYWVVHSQRLGFNRFAVSKTGGQVRGVVPKFTPTSGPFRTFVVLVEPTGKVHYLSRVKDIAWNP